MEHHSENKELKVFQEIYHSYYPDLCRYAARYVLTNEEAEEIVQNAIIKLWERRENLASITDVRRYLFRIIHNDCLNYLKHLQIKATHQQKVEAELKLISLQRSDPDSMVMKEMEKDINKAIGSLPDKCREVFILKRLEGKSIKEIAAKFDISPKTVEAFITKALKHMRIQLKNHLTIILL